MLISTVRTRALGFLAEPRRACVALTRAQHACVVFGCRGVLGGKAEGPGGKSVWGAWLEHVGVAVQKGVVATELEVS